MVLLHVTRGVLDERLTDLYYRMVYCSTNKEGDTNLCIHGAHTNGVHILTCVSRY